ncbi:MAG TPA: MFS transporter [Ktedonobacteraceae bacterium]|nr:MFS transporter [Ktedonobacteraceae bacterium]
MNVFIDFARQFGRFQRNAKLYLINTALGGVTTGILLILYNLYLTSLGYGTDFVGLVLFIGTIGGGIAIFPAGYIIDRVRAKPILIASNLLIALVGIGQILFRQPVPLLVTSFLAGIALVFTVVINAPFLTRNSVPEERPGLFSVNISLGLITLVVGEVVGGALPVWFRSQGWLMASFPSWASALLAGQPEARSYQLALLFAGLIAAPSLVPLFLMREARRPSIGRPASDRPASGDPSPGRPQGVSLHIDKTHPTGWVGGMVRTPFFFLALVYVITGLGAGLVIPYLNIFFVHHLHASSVLFGLVDGGANAATALLTLVAPWLAARVGRIRAIVLTRLLSIPLLLTIGLVGIVPLAALLYPFRQGIMDMSNGVLQVYSMEVVEERYRGLANSAYQAAFQVPWALTASLGGLLIAHFGYTLPFLLTALCYMAAIGILWGRFSVKSPQTNALSSELK